MLLTQVLNFLTRKDGWGCRVGCYFSKVTRAKMLGFYDVLKIAGHISFYPSLFVLTFHEPGLRTCSRVVWPEVLHACLKDNSHLRKSMDCLMRRSL